MVDLDFGFNKCLLHLSKAKVRETSFNPLEWSKKKKKNPYKGSILSQLPNNTLNFHVSIQRSFLTKIYI